MLVNSFGRDPFKNFLKGFCLKDFMAVNKRFYSPLLAGMKPFRSVFIPLEPVIEKLKSCLSNTVPALLYPSINITFKGIGKIHLGKGLVIFCRHYTFSNKEKYSSLVKPAVLKLFLIMNTGTSFQSGITTGLEIFCFVYTKWLPLILAHLNPAFSNTFRSLLAGMGVILGILRYSYQFSCNKLWRNPTATCILLVSCLFKNILQRSHLFSLIKKEPYRRVKHLPCMLNAIPAT